LSFSWILDPDSEETKSQPAVLTLGPSDAVGAMGVEADLRTFAGLGIHGLSIITGLFDIAGDRTQTRPITSDSALGQRLRELLRVCTPAAIKIGSLGPSSTVRVIDESLSDSSAVPTVLDPALTTEDGETAVDRDTVIALRHLAQQATLITVNRWEAELLTERRVDSPASMREAAKALFDLGPDHAVVTGGHLDKIVRDFHFDGTGFNEFGADRLNKPKPSGTGAVFSAAIAAHLALGHPVESALEKARESVSRAIRDAFYCGGRAVAHPLGSVWEK
jgi:hydroxymethylpyrimidine/phosphomethylpyrimidine kinase